METSFKQFTCHLTPTIIQYLGITSPWRLWHGKITFPGRHGVLTEPGSPTSITDHDRGTNSIFKFINLVETYWSSYKYIRTTSYREGDAPSTRFMIGGATNGNASLGSDQHEDPALRISGNNWGVNGYVCAAARWMECEGAFLWGQGQTELSHQ